MANKNALISIENNYGKKFIRIDLPLTNVTGKIRVKERSDNFSFGKPFSTKQNVINDKCYLEWQIGYDVKDESLSNEQVNFIREKTKAKKYIFELSIILLNGIKEKIFDYKLLDNLISFASSVNKENFIDNNYRIKRSNIGRNNLEGIEFLVLDDEYPVLMNINDEYQIEVVIKHKQRAVGYQCMLYLLLPLKNAMPSDLIGRSAKTNEMAYYFIDENQNNFIEDTFKVFSICSHDHNSDVKQILSAIKSSLEFEVNN
jgi:hypothetical protein